jgi:CheY-like chemotaxis protein
MEFKPKILVADDDPAVLRLLGELLKEMGAEPHLFAASPGAVEFVERDKLDGAILDWRMPEIDGLELARRIRQSPSNNKIPIVMLTGVTDTKAAEESFHVGINFFLQKPVSVTQLRSLLNASRGAMLQERRRYQRAPVFLRARCSWPERQTTGDIVSLSASGLMLSLDDPPPEGAEITLEFFLPHHPERMQCVGKVARVSDGPAPGQESGQGVGVEFTAIEPRHQRRVMEFVEKTLATLVSA